MRHGCCGGCQDRRVARGLSEHRLVDDFGFLEQLQVVLIHLENVEQVLVEDAELRILELKVIVQGGRCLIQVLVQMRGEDTFHEADVVVYLLVLAQEVLVSLGVFHHILDLSLF